MRPESSRRALRLTVNDEVRELLVTGAHTLLEVLREDLHLTGTKHGCDLGECGACTVLVDGRTRLACLTLASEVAGRSVRTIEGVAQGSRLHPLQQAFVELGAAQCGYCTPGMIMTAVSLLEAVPAPTRAQVKEALAGNLCRCTGYGRIVDAVLHAAAVMKTGRAGLPAARGLATELSE